MEKTKMNRKENLIVDPKIKTILNSSELIEARDRQFKRLEQMFDSGINEKVFCLSGYEVYETNPDKEPAIWVSEALKSLADNAEKIVDTDVFRPLCLEFGPYGVHFIDKILGAEVFFQDEQWYNRYLKTPIGELQYPDLEHDETWNFAKNIALEFLKWEVKLPLFGLPTIASALNVALNLYGQEILVELCMDPDKAMHDLELINKLLCELHRWYLSNIPTKQLQPVVSWHRTQPYGYGQICGCSNQLISAEMYQEYIAPLDNQLLSVYPNGGMIHLCGSHTQHIPVWREMKLLRAVQINDRAALDLEVYFNELRKDQIIYLNTFDGMDMDKALEITKGKRIVIVT